MPSNTTLTVDKILRACYAKMHQSSNFIMRLNRQYDPEFQRRELKQGQALRVRLPAQYSVRTGNTMSSQNYVERSISLPLATIKGVDLNFGQEELTWNIEDFTERVIAPAASVLIANVEADAMSMYKSVSNFFGVVTTTVGSGLTYLQFGSTGRYLSDNLAPPTDRNMCTNPESKVVFGNDVKGQFQDSKSLADLYVEGRMGRTGGFECFENTMIPSHASGTFTATTLTVTTTAGSPGVFDGAGNAYSAGPFSVNIDNGGSMTAFSFKKGDIVTFSAVFEVHRETKQSLGYLKRFTIAADVSGTTTGTITITPAPIAVGAYQNVCGAAGAQVGILDNAVITLIGPASAGASIEYGQNLMFHRDWAAFVTADLIDPSEFGAWGGRRVEDNLSLRIWRQGDIHNGNVPCRLDIAYGYVPIYPEWAARHVHVRQ